MALCALLYAGAIAAVLALEVVAYTTYGRLVEWPPPWLIVIVAVLAVATCFPLVLRVGAESDANVVYLETDLVPRLMRFPLRSWTTGQPRFLLRLVYGWQDDLSKQFENDEKRNLNIVVQHYAETVCSRLPEGTAGLTDRLLRVFESFAAAHGYSLAHAKTTHPSVHLMRTRIRHSAGGGLDRSVVVQNWLALAIMPKNANETLFLEYLDDHIDEYF